MRRFKTHSASSTTPSTSRKSSSVSGLFKSASSPTPPTNFLVNSTESTTTQTQTSTPTPTTSTTSTSTSTSYHQRSAALFRNYGRALNRSLHSGIGYVSGHNSHSQSHESDAYTDDQDDPALLCVEDANSTSNKSPLSPKLPSRFKFSKNKTKSNSSSWYSTSKSRNEHIKQGASCPGLVETTSTTNNNGSNCTGHKNNENKQTNTTGKPMLGKTKTSSNNGKNKPMLIRQYSDEHQNALIEKVIQEGNRSKSATANVSSKKEKGNKNQQTDSRPTSSKQKSKLRKMGALECSVPTDIVYEEGDSNKVTDGCCGTD